MYLNYDETQRDRFDRRLAYDWFELARDPYMVNEVMVRIGWVEFQTHQSHVKYKNHLGATEPYLVQPVKGLGSV